MDHNGRTVTVRKQREADGVVWSYIFHSEGDMHMYQSRVSLKEALIGGLAMMKAYHKIWDRVYKRRVINPAGRAKTVAEMMKWTYEELAGLEALSFKRTVTMTFFDGSHCYLYETVMPDLDKIEEYDVDDMRHPDYEKRFEGRRDHGIGCHCNRCAGD